MEKKIITKRCPTPVIHKLIRCMRKTKSIVGAVVLALRVQDALPIVRLPSLLGVRVDEHLDVPPEEAGAHVEDRQVLLLDGKARQGADDGWRGAPIDQLARRHLE